MPWYAWYPDDFASKTRRLTLEQKGAFRALLDEYYAMAEALPQASVELYRIVGAQLDSERAAVDVVVKLFFYEKSGRLHNRRADEELLKQSEIRTNLSTRGKAGASARWSKKMPEAMQQAMPEAMLEQCDESCLANGISTSHISHITAHNSQPQGESTRRDRSGKGKKTAMPDEFAVSDRVRTWAEKKGYGNLDQHLEHFRLQATARGYTYADWDSALMKAISTDWAGVRINGHDRSTETLADLLAKDANGQPQAD